MIKSNQIAPGMTINIGKKIYRVESSMKINVVRGAPFIKTKLRDLLTDEVIEKNFKLDQEIKEVTLTEKRLEYLYPENNHFLFLDVDNLEQEKVPLSILGDKVNYLKEGMTLQVASYKEKIVDVEMPLNVELEVTETQPGFKGDTVTAGTKPATVETGITVQVPMFINTGDIIKVDTRDGSYIERA